MSQPDRDHKRDPGEQIVHDLAMAPALDIDSNQRAELLQRWHTEDAAQEADEKEAQEHEERERPQR